MRRRAFSALMWLFGPQPSNRPGHLWPRWIFLRALGLIYFSAFYSLWFQIQGLIGPQGILPAGEYLEGVARYFGPKRFWFAPTLLWLGSSDHALRLLCWAGIVAALLLVVNFWPRGMLLICLVAFLSFVAAAQDFSEYQSDGMLLAAGFLCLFFAPRGVWPRLGRARPPSRATLFLLQWLWFRIYFESGVAKMASGDPAWRHLTAMDDYYQNGPLPTWIGWYVQKLPHGFHASTALLTLLVELALVWMVFLPRRFRILCFFIVTPFEIGIILTANYAFLNYLVLSLGILLLDDRFLASLFRRNEAQRAPAQPAPHASGAPESGGLARWKRRIAAIRLCLSAVILGGIWYATTALLLWMIFPGLPLPETPVRVLEPFRIANRYGLFAVMTHARYEIEFQGSDDGRTWMAYPFRYKPQDPHKSPGIFAPYQPRFDWNLWFASLGSWRQYPFVLRTEELLLKNDPAVLALFAGDPFERAAPRQVRAVIWQYWFTDGKTKRAGGTWWRRELLGLYAPVLERDDQGRIYAVPPAGFAIPSP